MILITVIALIPCQTRGYENRLATTGILQAGIIIAQTTYATFSTLNSQVPVNLNGTELASNCTNGTEPIERCFQIPLTIANILRLLITV